MLLQVDLLLGMPVSIDSAGAVTQIRTEPERVLRRLFPIPVVGGVIPRGTPPMGDQARLHSGVPAMSRPRRPRWKRAVPALRRLMWPCDIGLTVSRHCRRMYRYRRWIGNMC